MSHVYLVYLPDSLRQDLCGDREEVGESVPAGGFSLPLYCPPRFCLDFYLAKSMWVRALDSLPLPVRLSIYLPYFPVSMRMNRSLACLSFGISLDFGL